MFSLERIQQALQVVHLKILTHFVTRQILLSSAPPQIGYTCSQLKVYWIPRIVVVAIANQIGLQLHTTFCLCNLNIFCMFVRVLSPLACCDGSNYVQSSMFNRSKPKVGCLSLITRRWTCSSPFNVRKNDVQDCSMSCSVNLMKALLGLMFDVRSLETKNWGFEFDHQYMNTFELVRSLKNDVWVWCSTHNY